MTRQEMREAIRPLMSEERYRHSLGVEKEAERLARRWGEDPEKAAIAGILHDCCKEMPLPEALQIMRRSAIMTEIDFREQPQLTVSVIKISKTRCATTPPAGPV